ncbi:BadF/BadG/BcrA/BcrD ATPase family protein [uncultured Tateyamaria sp.]|uniref:BadF/BadG/BcrA/BcrD ATPase family protein n=1 Tax=uncultured Tateyamaria sp. TaxID=455651 RepID=UPI00261E905B|nr:BadF/BadG/BcrA/BcrD ATPase family protein [uncultured Tateyamaria sp.]
MSRSDDTLVIAIDGGGTRCRMNAFERGDVVSVETGSANVSTDFDRAVREVVRGLQYLAERMSRPVEELSAAPTFVGLAGVTGTDITDRLRAALPFRLVRIADDRPAAVRGVLGQRDGVIAHCGTGSFYAAQFSGDIKLAGGWGPVLGDEASAQWVGRMALQLTLETVDGRADATALSERILTEFDGASGLVGFAGAALPSEFGKLAPQVTNAAADGDALALKIMSRGGDEVARAIRHLGWQAGVPLCLTGGIGPHYGPYLPENVRTCLSKAEGEPLDGAMSLALDFAREIADEHR